MRWGSARETVLSEHAAALAGALTARPFLATLEQLHFESACWILSQTAIYDSEPGPRANPNLTLQQRNSYQNLILLCATHHALVDRQPNTYTVAELRKWKNFQETRHKEYLRRTMAEVTFKELELVTQVLVNGNGYRPSPVSTIPPQDKMDRNGLTGQSSRLFSIGLLQAPRVREFVEFMGSHDATFVGRLISGFTGEYQRLRQEGLAGDSLFAAMLRFSTQGRGELIHNSAGLAVLVYLFERCEVFER